jgi:hypothetical protein
MQRRSTRKSLDDAHHNWEVFREAVGGLMIFRADGRMVGVEELEN